MTALLSSPMGPPMRFDNLFDQSESPSRRHEELPADFDRSFGSSMSISSSFDGSEGSHSHTNLQDAARLTSSSSMGTIYGRHSASTEAGPSNISPSPSTSSFHSSLSPSHNVTRKRTSPTSNRTLGAAMGTELNGKSPGLAAKMGSPQASLSPLSRSSPHYMDISPAPARPFQNLSSVFEAATPLSLRQSIDIQAIGTGSAMKLDTPECEQKRPSSSSSSASSSPASSHPLVLPSKASRSSRSRPSSRPNSRASSRKASPELGVNLASSMGSGSLGRLFGTNMSLNHLADGRPPGLEGELESDVSIDKEPPAKRRPASLPLGEGKPFVRPSLKSAGMPKRASGSSIKMARTNDMIEQGLDVTEEASVENVCQIPSSQPFHPIEALKKLHRASEPSLAQQHKASNLPSSSDVPSFFNPRPSRSRHGSAESASSNVSEGFVSCIRERHQDMGLGNLATHATIMESPSPSTFERQDLGSYFFDPQSPNVSFNSITSGGSRSQVSQPTSSLPSAAPSVQNLQRPRPFLKSHTAGIVPTASSVGQESRSSSFLGKRPNPYSKKPSQPPGFAHLSGPSTTKSSASRPSVDRMQSSTASSSSGSRFAALSSKTVEARPTMPAPRRCQSSVDQSSILGRFNAGTLSHRKASSGLASGSLMPESTSTGSNLSISMLDSDDGGPSPSPSMGFPEGFDASGSPVAPSVKSRHLRPSMMRRPSKDDSSPLPYGTRRQTDRNEAGLTLDYTSGINASPSLRRLGTVGEGADSGSPSMQISSPFSGECMPGFGASERAGKVLPCFNVKEDGLMRVTPQTLVELMRGEYNDRLESYQVVDCRFGYEYQGGHIPGAINLSTIDQVKTHFLSEAGPNGCGRPPRSQSGQADSYGNVRKPILVFHCEFSAKRAPSMALALRQADRGLAQDYPNCHYPEVYILQGGYCGFFSAFRGLCEPNAYVQMDDPAYQDQRSAELNGFRKQFSRHRSFTYGDSSKGSVPYGNALTRRPIQPADRLSYDSKHAGMPSMDSMGACTEFMHDPRPTESRMTKMLGKPTLAGLMSEEESSFDESSCADSPSARAALAMQSNLASKKAQASKPVGASTMLHSFPSTGSIEDGGADEDSSLDSSFDCSLNLGSDAHIPTTLTRGPLDSTGSVAQGGQSSPAVNKADRAQPHVASQRRPFQRAGTTGSLFPNGR